MARQVDVGDDGLSIGEIYVLRDGNDVELIPRSQISFVSAEYASQKIFLVLAVITFLIGGWTYLSNQSSGAGVVISSIVATLFVVAFFVTRRAVVVVGSSGGKLAYEVRGRRRFELLELIYEDLEQHLSPNRLQRGLDPVRSALDS